MSTATSITIVGGITADPENRSRDGKGWATFSVATAPSKFNRDTNAWENGTPTYWPCSANNKLAEAILAQCRKGTQVVLVGTVASRSWDKDGVTQSRMEVQVQSLGIVPRADSTSQEPTDSWGSGQQQQAERYDGMQSTQEPTWHQPGSTRTGLTGSGYQEETPW